MRVLIAHPYGIGDVLFSLPLVRAIRRADPECWIGYLCNRRTEEIIALWPELNWRRAFEKDEFRTTLQKSRWEGVGFLASLTSEIRRQKFDCLFDLSLGWQTGFLSACAGIPRRIGFDYRGRGRFLTDKTALDGFDSRPVADHYLDLLIRAGIPRPELTRDLIQIDLPQSVREESEQYLHSIGIPAGRRFFALVPGGGASWGANAVYKQWPPERFAELAERLLDRYTAELVILGDQTELELCRSIAQKIKKPVSIAAPVPSLKILAGLLSQAHLVIGNDSGPMHMATAVGAHAVSIFGPVDSAVYGPALIDPRHRVVTRGIACQPCYHHFRFPPCPWDNGCLKALPVEPVLEAAEKSLQTRAA